MSWVWPSYGEVVERWQSDEAFRDRFTAALADSEHSAFFWETPPISAATVDRPFEFVLVDSPALARARPQPEPFETEIGDGRGTNAVRTFENLGGDAVLVVPCAAGPLESYTHLAAFVRLAPREQVHRLWRAVGAAVAARLQSTTERIWVSTSGLGVHWVHVRIDSRPKYYNHAPYRS